MTAWSWAGLIVLALPWFVILVLLVARWFAWRREVRAWERAMARRHAEGGA